MSRSFPLTEKSETFYDTVHRIAGEEVVDYVLNYNSAGKVSSKTIYLYGAGYLTATNANYRDTLSQSQTYRTWYDNSGNLVTGTMKSATFYHTTGRLKGEEVADYAYDYDRTGAKVTSKTIYIYEGGKLAAASTTEDLMERSDTYRIAGYNVDGSPIIGTLKSQTYYNLTDASGAKRSKGEEIADYTYGYEKTGTKVTSKTIYIYEGNVDAANAAAADLMIETDTYRIAGYNVDGSPIIGTPISSVAALNKATARLSVSIHME